jgi:hypothetical protein
MVMPKCNRLVTIENSVVSWPPCWVAVEVKGAADLAVQRSPGPQPAGLVEEIRHLRGHAAKARAGAHNDSVVIGEIVDLCDRCSLIELVVRRFRDIRWYQLRHPLDIDGGTGRARAFGDGVRHGLDVSVGGIIENENFCHGGSP